MTDVNRLLKCKHKITRVLEGDKVTVQTGDGKGNSVGSTAAVASRPGFMISDNWQTIHVSDTELMEARSERETRETVETPVRHEPELLPDHEAPPDRIYRCECKEGYSYSALKWWEWEQAMARARKQGERKRSVALATVRL